MIKRPWLLQTRKVVRQKLPTPNFSGKCRELVRYGLLESLLCEIQNKNEVPKTKLPVCTEHPSFIPSGLSTAESLYQVQEFLAGRRDHNIFQALDHVGIEVVRKGTRS